MTMLFNNFGQFASAFLLNLSRASIAPKANTKMMDGTDYGNYGFYLDINSTAASVQTMTTSYMSSDWARFGSIIPAPEVSAYTEYSSGNRGSKSNVVICPLNQDIVATDYSVSLEDYNLMKSISTNISKDTGSGYIAVTLTNDTGQAKVIDRLAFLTVNVFTKTNSNFSANPASYPKALQLVAIQSLDQPVSLADNETKILQINLEIN